MIDCPVLMKDLEGALKTTLKMYVNLESIRSSAFKKKFSALTAQNIQKISTELEVLQSKYEGFPSKTRKMLPVLSQKLYPRTRTPILSSSSSQKNKNYLKTFVRASNSRLCNSRAGNIERNLKSDLFEESPPVSTEERLRKKESNLEELFGQVHHLPKPSERSFVELKKVKEFKKLEILKKNVEILMKRVENPESTIHKCINSFQKVKEQQNLEFLKKIQRKIATPGSELTKRTNRS